MNAKAFYLRFFKSMEDLEFISINILRRFDFYQVRALKCYERDFMTYLTANICNLIFDLIINSHYKFCSKLDLGGIGGIRP